MTERLPSPSSEHKNESNTYSSGERHPTDDEIREFETVRNAGLPGAKPIENFARDPEHPTEAEIREMNDYNRTALRPFGDMTFEDYFGYPDPRQHERQHPDDNQSPDDQRK